MAGVVYSGEVPAADTVITAPPGIVRFVTGVLLRLCVKLHHCSLVVNDWLLRLAAFVGSYCCRVRRGELGLPRFLLLYFC